MISQERLKQIIEDYRNRLAATLGDELDSIVLYGSQARQEAVEASDIVVAIQILREEDGRSDTKPQQPETVNEAVERLVAELPLKDKTTIANMDESDLVDLHFSLGITIRNRFLYPGNDKLLESCRHVSQDKFLHWDQASAVIIKELWKKLRETYKLRVLK